VEGGLGPDGGGSEESGEDGFGPAGGAVEGGYGRRFIGGVAEPLAGESRLDFEDGVDAFGGDVDSGGVGEEQGGMELVEDGDVDLAGAAAGGIDDEGGGGAVGLGEIAVKHFQPEVFGGGSGGGGVFEEAAYG